MDELKISLPYLDGLTTAELYALAERFELDLPPGLGRVAVMEELVDIAPCLVFYQSGNAETPPPASGEKTQLLLPQPAALPKQYNMTYVDVLIRDPFWVFVIWEISAQERKNQEKLSSFQGYTLRVRRAPPAAEADGEFLYTVRITEHLSSRYLSFPPGISGEQQGGAADAYIVELCALYREEIAVLVASHPFYLPKSMPGFAGAPAQGLCSPILLLSGIEKLTVPRGAR